MTLLQIVREVAACLAWICDEFDPQVRDRALEDLEHDVATWLAGYERRET